MGNCSCVIYLFTFQTSIFDCKFIPSLLESFERLWKFVGVSSSYLHITSILDCTLTGFVGFWEFVGLSFGYMHSKLISTFLLCIYLGAQLKIMEMDGSVFYLPRKLPSWIVHLLMSFEGLWRLVGVSSSYMHINNLKLCIHSVALWDCGNF